MIIPDLCLANRLIESLLTVKVVKAYRSYLLPLAQALSILNVEVKAQKCIIK